MIRRAIGRNGPTVNAIGLGCMGMAAFYGEPMPEADAAKLLHTAIDLGVDHFDTAELYGGGLNERQLGAAFHDRRDKVFIATKFGPIMDGGQRLGVDGSPMFLLANAVDALQSTPGRITLSTEVVTGTGEPPAVRMTVADSGRGMSAEEARRIFDDFYTTKEGGSGLGLSIVRRLLMDINATIDVDTAPGKGTRFVIDIPTGP